MRAMVMAAGLGTRLAPLTDHLPKPLMPVCNRPVLEHLLRRIAGAGIVDVAINLHWHADAIRAAFGDGSQLGLRIHWRDEQKLLGTAGGTRMFDGLLGADGDPFLVTSADGFHDVDLRALIARHSEAAAFATLTVKAVPDPQRYGVALVDSDGVIEGFQEKPAPQDALSDLASCGVYVFEPRVFDHIEKGSFSDWARDVLPAAMAAGERLAAYRTEAYWNDVGTISELVNSNLDPLRGLVDLGLDAGEDGVLIGEGAQVSESATLIGPVVVGPGARIGDGAVVREAVLLAEAVVAPGAIVAGGLVGDVAALGRAWT